MKCPKCDGVLSEHEGVFVCEGCGARFKKKATQSEQKQEEQDVQNTTVESEVQPEPKQESETSEIELLKARLAEMEKRQSEMESNGDRRNVDMNGMLARFKETKFFAFLKKWGLKAVLPCALVIIVFISLMVCLVGVRGVYYNVDNPNEFYSFSSSGYKYYGDFNGEEYVDKGTWKIKDGKLYLTYKDEDFGKQTDDYYFTKQSNDVIFIGETKDSISEFRRVTLLQYKPSSNKTVTVKFDANGGMGGKEEKKTFGSKSKEAPKTEREGYVFKGWYKHKYGYKISGSKPYEEGKRVWEDVTYYANWWNDAKYTVIIDDGLKILSIEEGDFLLDKLKESEKDFEFDYYIDGDTIVDENTYMPNHNVYVTRKSKNSNQVTITFRANGGSFSDTNNSYRITCSSLDRDIRIKTPYKSDMFFIGYGIYNKNTSSYEVVTFPTGEIRNDFWDYVHEDCVLTAMWMDYCIEMADFYYRIDGSDLVICDYYGESENVIIPYGVTKIKDDAFAEHDNIVSITLPNSIRHIGKGAFRKCKNLTEIVIGDSVVSVGNGAFSECSKLRNIDLPNSVESIGQYAFSGCSNMVEFTVPYGVTKIEYYLFRNCSSLQSLTLFDRIENIDDMCIIGCSNLTRINYAGSKNNFAQWVHKGEYWNERAGNYLIYCTDGTIENSRYEQEHRNEN